MNSLRKALGNKKFGRFIFGILAFGFLVWNKQFDNITDWSTYELQGYNSFSILLASIAIYIAYSNLRILIRDLKAPLNIKEKKKSTSELQGKWWYRFIQVIFFVLFLVTSTIITFLVYQQAKVQVREDYIITCLYGNQSSFALRQDMGIFTSEENLYDTMSANENQIVERCGLTQADEYAHNMLYGGDGEPMFTVRAWNPEVGPAFGITFKVLGAFLITLFVFEGVRRVFYYIALGTFWPTHN